MSDRNPNVSASLGVALTAAPMGGATALAQGLQEVGGKAIEMRVGQLENKVSTELFEMQKEFLEGLDTQDAADPMLELSFEEGEAYKGFAALQAKLQLASEQGDIPVTELKIRQERVLRDYMRRYPGLADRFQQAAAGVLGYNPIGTEIASLTQQQRMRQSEAQQIYSRIIAAADRAGVNPMLQLQAPEVYWYQVEQALSFEGRLAELDRRLKEESTLGSLNKNSARVHLRRGLGGLMHAAKNGIVERISGAQSAMASLDPDSRAQAIRAGAFDQTRDALMMERSAFVANSYGEYFANSDMTMAELEAELKPVLDLYDFAIRNINDENAVTKLNNLVKVNESEFFLRYPEAQRLNLMSDLLNSHAVASAIQRNREIGKEMARIVGLILNPALGGQNVPGAFETPPVSTPGGRVNPASADATLPPMASFESPEVAVGMVDVNHDLMVQSLNFAKGRIDPFERDEALRFSAQRATAFANFYLEHYRTYNQVLSEDMVDQYIYSIADKSMLPVWVEQNQLNPREVGERRKVSDAVSQMIQSEAGRSYRNILEQMREAMGHEVRSLMRAQELSALEVITPRWDDAFDKPYFELDEAEFDRLGPTSAWNETSVVHRQKRQLKRAIEQLNAHPDMSRLGALIKAQSHVEEGHTRYAETALRMAFQMLEILPE